MKKISLIPFAAIFASLLLAVSACKVNAENEKVVVAYVTSWSRIVPDPFMMTHINYAFGHVNDTFDGIRVDNPRRLRMLVDLKKQNPDLNVMLSVGGWGSGRFSEMASTDSTRLAFALDCSRVIEEYGLDGIDIDWEYPTSNAAGISSSPEDTRNFTLLMEDIRSAIGEGKQLTLASVASAEYIDFKAIMPYVDFVNIMSYDMGTAPRHHSPLYESEICGWMSSDMTVKKHIEAGVPPSKLVLGMPFYGRGGTHFPNFVDYKLIAPDSVAVEKWDEKAQAPYLANDKGELLLGYDNPRSLEIKCRYVLDNGLLGAMYWDYDGDNATGDLQKTVAGVILGAE